GNVPGTPEELLAEADTSLRAWAGEAARAYREGRDIASALAERFASDAGAADPAVRAKLETLNGFHSNAAGFHRWLETRQDAPDGSSGVPSHHERGADHERRDRVAAQEEQTRPR
ncbi:MAG: hypothetical protein ACYCR4_03395, partial [Acidimicrobiales bacterium]